MSASSLICIRLYLTEFTEFCPVPITDEIIQGIVSVPRIHLLCATGCLNEFGPKSFDFFPIGPSRAFRVIERVSILTVVLVTLKVHFPYKKFDALGKLAQPRKGRVHSVAEVSAVLATDVICYDMPDRTFVVRLFSGFVVRRFNFRCTRTGPGVHVFLQAFVKGMYYVLKDIIS